ncbi:MAG TPA: hypothetical protein VN878_07735 [Usitatibacter sp.]|nr:hypothetical protein [Usitatibacter sp.]
MWTRNLSCLTLASALASAPVSADDWWRREHASDPGTYLFVWDLSRATLGRDSPDHALRTYYRGLMFALIEGRAMVTRDTPAAVKLAPMAAVTGWSEAYTGTLRTWITSPSGAALALNAEITRRDCDRNRSQVFFALSTAPPEDALWDKLRATRALISCDKSRN